MLYHMKVETEDADRSYVEDLRFDSESETFLQDAARKFLYYYAGLCSDCPPGGSTCEGCEPRDHAPAVIEQFLGFTPGTPLTISVPGDYRNYTISELGPVEPVLIHVLNGRVEWVRHLPDPGWPWDVTYEWTNHEQTS